MLASDSIAVKRYLFAGFQTARVGWISFAPSIARLTRHLWHLFYLRSPADKLIATYSDIAFVRCKFGVVFYQAKERLHYGGWRKAYPPLYVGWPSTQITTFYEGLTAILIRFALESYIHHEQLFNSAVLGGFSTW